jgi:ribosomal protein L29
MERYNKHIADELLRRSMGLIHHLPQPTMFGGGGRPREYVLPFTTEYEGPSTLAVGVSNGSYPATLQDSFWGEAMTGGMSYDAFKKSKLGKVAVPVGKKLAEKHGEKALEKYLSGNGMYVDEEECESSSDEEGEMSGGMYHGGKKKYGVSRFVKDLGKISKAIGLKQVLKPIAQAATKKAVSKIEGSGRRRGRPRKGGALLTGEDEGLTGAYPPNMSTVYKGGKKKYGVSRFVKDLGKISKAVGLKQVLKPIAQAATKKAVEKIEGAGRRGRPMKSAVMSAEDLGMEGGKKKYGVSRFVKDLGKISKAVGLKQVLKPIAQAATKKAVGKIEGAGRGRSARAEIVKKVMADKGLSMIEASKYVKANNLY